MSQKAFYVLVGFLLGLVVCALLNHSVPVGAQVPPQPRTEQQRPDIFPCEGCTITDKNGDGVANMQDLSPVNIKAKATMRIRYRVQVLNGCLRGEMDSILNHLNTVEAPKFRLDLAIDNVNYDFTVYWSCGIVQVDKCGSVNVFCLPDGFPYKSDVYMSDVLSTWDAGSKVGIPIHEIIGHAILIWNEQYAVCGASCNFQPTPNLRDVMNTGPLSRHGIEDVEMERFARTGWSLVTCGRDSVQLSGLAWDTCTSRWYNASGWSYDPVTGIWYDPKNVARYSGCNADRLRWSYTGSLWKVPNDRDGFDPTLNQWLVVPAC